MTLIDLKYILFLRTLTCHIFKLCMLKKLTILHTLSALFINSVWQYHKILCNFGKVLKCSLLDSNVFNE